MYLDIYVCFLLFINYLHFFHLNSSNILYSIYCNGILYALHYHGIWFYSHTSGFQHFMNATFSSLDKGVISRDLYYRTVDTIHRQQLCDVFSPDSVLPSRKEITASSNTLVCFHGSPGCKEDFNELNKLIPDISLHAYPRKNYPGFSNTFLDCVAQRENQVLTGYSWGCRELLEYYAKNHSNIELIILISPYILNSSKSALSTKSRLIAGLIKKILMKIENSISDISRNNYDSSYSDKHSLLKKSLLYFCGLYEKTEHQEISYASILRLIAELDTPVHVIAGTSDTTIHCQQSQELINAINRNVFYHYINGGNHDILKTHVHQIARILKQITQRSINVDKNQFRCQSRESSPYSA